MSAKLKAKIEELMEDTESAIKLARKENRDDLADQLVDAKDVFEEAVSELDEPETEEAESDE